MIIEWQEQIKDIPTSQYLLKHESGILPFMNIWNNLMILANSVALSLEMKKFIKTSNNFRSLKYIF